MFVIAENIMKRPVLGSNTAYLVSTKYFTTFDTHHQVLKTLHHQVNARHLWYLHLIAVILTIQ